MRDAVAWSGIVLLVAACSPVAPEPKPVSRPSASGVPGRVEVRISDSFTPRTTDADIENFVAEIAAVDSGGECQVMRTGNVTRVTAYFPSQASYRMTNGIAFDSSGHVIQFNESRYAEAHVRMPPMPREKLDSAVRAMRDEARSTSITLNYPFDQGIATNRGGGRPTDGILTTVRRLERAPRFGPLTQHMARMRALCGV
jgi:hypothetical protein